MPVVGAQSLHGGLIDGVTNATFRCRPVDDETRAKTERIAEVCHEHGVPTAAVALQFPLGHPAVRCVLTGPATREQLEENLAWAALPIPPSVWVHLRDDGLLPREVPVPSLDH
ncbi:aldo/keto reductase [Catenulispora subtropica]|uniref:NADP-dependent oxidoreductase domain-containing protein n=1 Tax=Catenulispora subtropica TaxID=450798 RepID=A0ABN2SH23_9ACTN